LKNNEVLLLLFAVIYTRIWKSVDFFWNSRKSNSEKNYICVRCE